MSFIQLSDLRTEFDRDALTVKESKECCARWLAGDSAARNKLICGSRFLVLNAIQSCIRSTEGDVRPYLDDYLSVGLEAVVKAVDDIPNVFDPERCEHHPPAYIYQRVRWSFKQVPWRPMLCMTNHTIARYRKQEREHELPDLSFDMPLDAEITSNPIGDMEVMEWATGQFHQDQDKRRMVEMLFQGYAVSEIRHELGLAKTTAYKLRNQVRKELSARLDQEVLK